MSISWKLSLSSRKSDTFAGGQFAQFVLAVDGSLAASVLRLVTQLAKLLDTLFSPHAGDPCIEWIRY